MTYPAEHIDQKITKALVAVGEVLIVQFKKSSCGNTLIAPEILHTEFFSETQSNSRKFSGGEIEGIRYLFCRV